MGASYNKTRAGSLARPALVTTSECCRGRQICRRPTALSEIVGYCQLCVAAVTDVGEGTTTISREVVVFVSDVTHVQTNRQILVDSVVGEQIIHRVAGNTTVFIGATIRLADKGLTG